LEYLSAHYPNANITLFEKEEIGGRIKSINIADKDKTPNYMDLGATFFIKDNVVLMDLINKYNVIIKE